MVNITPENGTRNWQQLLTIEDGKPVFTDNAPLLRWLADDGKRPTDEWLASQGYYGLTNTAPPTVDEEEGYVVQTPIESWEVNEESKTVIEGWEIVYFTDAEKAWRLEDAWRSFREQRDSRLRECDWTQLADSPMLGNTEWLTYRQALRDLPSVTIDPRKPEWPAIPQ